MIEFDTFIDLWDYVNMLIGMWDNANLEGIQVFLLVFIVWRVVAMTASAINRQSRTNSNEG